MSILVVIFWLLVAHFVGDYSLQTVEMAKFKNKKNTPIPPPGAKPVSVWFAYLVSHGFVHAGLAALVVGVPAGFFLGVCHTIQDYFKTSVVSQQ